MPMSCGRSPGRAARSEKPSALRSQPGVIEKFKPQGIEPMPLTPAQFDALIANEIESNKAIVKAAGLKFN